MRLNRLFIICCSALAVLSFAGCKKAIKTDVDTTLTPLGETAVPGQLLEWVAIDPDESFSVIFEKPGLCKEQGPIQARYKNPAKCTVLDQKLKKGDQPIIYNYVLNGTVHGRPINNPVKYRVAVRGPGICPWCKP
jgi:hypothetical protein